MKTATLEFQWFAFQASILKTVFEMMSIAKSLQDSFSVHVLIVTNALNTTNPRTVGVNEWIRRWHGERQLIHHHPPHSPHQNKHTPETPPPPKESKETPPKFTVPVSTISQCLSSRLMVNHSHIHRLHIHPHLRPRVPLADSERFWHTVSLKTSRSLVPPVFIYRSRPTELIEEF